MNGNTSHRKQVTSGREEDDGEDDDDDDEDEDEDEGAGIGLEEGGRRVRFFGNNVFPPKLEGRMIGFAFFSSKGLYFPKP